jgi:L-iditol 2-dehydrogenase
MMATMKAIFLTRNRHMEPGVMEKPTPKQGQALIKIMHIGICGSDLHYYENTMPDRVIPYPYLLGHECAGEVVQIGEGVSSLRVGDRVALEPGVTCGTCEFCKSGRYNLCPDVIFFSTPPVPGTLCEFVSHPADKCFKLPDNVNTLEGALVEPLAVGFHACRLAQAMPGKTATILGSGCIGMCSLLALKAHGVGTVYITEPLQKRRERGKSLGADEAIDINSTDPVKRILELTGGRGTDIVIEASGNTDAAKSSGEIVARGGKIVMVGMASVAEYLFDFVRLIHKEASIETLYRYRNCYPAAIAAIAAGLPVAKIMSHRFKFEDSPTAFEQNLENRAEIVKAVIEL